MMLFNLWVSALRRPLQIVAVIFCLAVLFGVSRAQAQPMPFIATFSPFYGNVGDTVTISGYDLIGVTAVKFNGVYTGNFHTNPDGSIAAVVPRGATTGPISVTTPYGTVRSNFNFYMGPIIESFSPKSGSWGTEVKIVGKNLDATTGVNFGGITATFNVVSPTLLTTKVPNGAKTCSINLTTINDSGVLSDLFLVGPSFTDFTPTMGSPGTIVTINGNNFTGATAVKFHGVPGKVLSLSDTVIEAVVPVGATTGSISVTTLSGTSYTAASFYIGPYITSFYPSSGRVGTRVQIHGHNFTGATTVEFGNVWVTPLVVSDILIDAIVPIGATTAPLGVTTPLGTSYIIPGFTVGPTITSFSPSAGGVGDTVTITGGDFSSATSVKFNGVNAREFHVDSETSMTAVVPPGAASGLISVTTAAGTGYSSSAFNVGPIVTSFSPKSGVAGTPVTITGKNFTGVYAVEFNGVAATTFNVESDTSITAVAPAGATGPIHVVSLNGVGTSPTSFVFLPMITDFGPASGAIGSLVTIDGTGFTGATAVKFHGVAAKTFFVFSDVGIQAVVPLGATTGPISVTTPLGIGTSATNFAVTPGG